jgi:putative membrane protein
VTAHAHGGGAGGPALAVLLALSYELLALRVDGWSRRRSAVFLFGCLLLLLGLALPVHGFGEHMLGHLLIAMLAPLALVLGRPVTLLLRALSAPHARLVTHALRSRMARAVAHPVTALTASSGTLLLLYLTPLYARAVTDPALHDVMQVHFVLSGYLFAWVVAGTDPAPHRPSVPARLVVLAVAIGVHATLAQLLYAGAWVRIPGPEAGRQAGATIMYYGGDVAELLLAFAVVHGARRAGWPGRVTRWPGRVTATGTPRPWSSSIPPSRSPCRSGGASPGWRRGSGPPSSRPSPTPIPATSPPTSPAAPGSAIDSSG